MSMVVRRDSYGMAPAGMTAIVVVGGSVVAEPAAHLDAVARRPDAPAGRPYVSRGGVQVNARSRGHGEHGGGFGEPTLAASAARSAMSSAAPEPR